MGGLERLRAADRDAQLAANLARAQQLAGKARELIVNDYALAASSIAKTLGKLATIDSEVRAPNARRPPGTVDVQIEAFRGYSATLGETVVLPGITSDDADFWSTRPRRLTINEILREELIVVLDSYGPRAIVIRIIRGARSYVANRRLSGPTASVDRNNRNR